MISSDQLPVPYCKGYHCSLLRKHESWDTWLHFPVFCASTVQCCISTSYSTTSSWPAHLRSSSISSHFRKQRRSRAPKGLKRTQNTSEAQTRSRQHKLEQLHSTVFKISIQSAGKCGLQPFHSFNIFKQVLVSSRVASPSAFYIISETCYIAHH